MIEHVLIDMDGVLCDFVEAAFRAHGGIYDESTYPKGEYLVANVLGISMPQFWKNIDELGEDFWVTLNPYPWMDELIATVEDEVGVGNWSIASFPSDASFSASGKVRWIQDKFGRDFRRYMLGEEKFRMAKPGVVLIDDHPVNCRAFVDAGGEAIEFPQPCNGNVTQHRIAFVKESFSNIKARSCRE